METAVRVAAEAVELKKGRDFSLDVLKSLAIFGVIVIHVCSYQDPVRSFGWVASITWGSLVRASVPIFFMCSGALLLSPDRPFSAKQFFQKNFLRIVVAMFVWAMGYQIYHLTVDGNLTLQGLWQAVKAVLLFHQEFHLYYLQILLIVYLCLPITRILTQYATRQQLRYFLLLWFALGIVYPTVLPFWPFTLLSGIPLQYKINMTYAALGYGVLGFYLKRYPPQRRRGSVLLALCGFFLIWGGTYVFSLRGGTLYQGFFEGMSPGTCLLAAGIFGFCVKLSPPMDQRIKAAAVYLSKASFCIYLTHVFFIYLLSGAGVSTGCLSTMISIPLIACGVFLCSLPVYVVLSHIPVVRKWLV